MKQSTFIKVRPIVREVVVGLLEEIEGSDTIDFVDNGLPWMNIGKRIVVLAKNVWYKSLKKRRWLKSSCTYGEYMSIND